MQAQLLRQTSSGLVNTPPVGMNIEVLRLRSAPAASRAHPPPSTLIAHAEPPGRRDNGDRRAMLAASFHDVADTSIARLERLPVQALSCT